MHFCKTFINIGFVHPLAIFADPYNFLTVLHSSAVTVHTKLCSLILTVNFCKTEKLFTVLFLDALFGTLH